MSDNQIFNKPLTAMGWAAGLDRDETYSLLLDHSALPIDAEVGVGVRLASVYLAVHIQKNMIVVSNRQGLG